MKMHPNDMMEFLEVEVCGTVTEKQTVKDYKGKKVILKKGDKLYFVNPVFSMPDYGFIMTKNGIALKRSKMAKEGFKKMPPLTDEQIEILLGEAMEDIKKGRIGGLKLGF